MNTAVPRLLSVGALRGCMVAVMLPEQAVRSGKVPCTATHIGERSSWL